MLVFFPFHFFCEGKALDLTALASLPNTPAGAALSLHHQAHGQLNQSHTCDLSALPSAVTEPGSVCHMHPVLQHYTAFRNLSTVWSHPAWLDGLKACPNPSWLFAEVRVWHGVRISRAVTPHVCHTQHTHPELLSPCTFCLLSHMALWKSKRWKCTIINWSS